MLDIECSDKKVIKRRSRKAGFGIMEVMVSILVLGFLYAAVNSLQVTNDESVHRLRCRDGAVQVAQEIMDSLKSIGSASIVVKDGEDTLDLRTRTWERGLGGNSVVKYTPIMTVDNSGGYDVQSGSDFEFGKIQRTVAKQVNIRVEWPFKGSVQSINVSGVIR